MTGREQITLDVAFEMFGKRFDRLEEKVDQLDSKVDRIELGDAQRTGIAAGTAAAVASAEANREKRTISRGRLLAMIASVTAIAGALGGLVFSTLHAFHIL